MSKIIEVETPADEEPKITEKTNLTFLDLDRRKRIIKLMKKGVNDDTIENVVPGLTFSALHEWKKIGNNILYNARGEARSEEELDQLSEMEKQIAQTAKEMNDAKMDFIEGTYTAGQRLMLGLGEQQIDGKTIVAGNPILIKNAMDSIAGKDKKPTITINTTENNLKINQNYVGLPQKKE